MTEPSFNEQLRDLHLETVMRAMSANPITIGAALTYHDATDQDTRIVAAQFKDQGEDAVALVTFDGNCCSINATIPTRWARPYPPALTNISYADLTPETIRETITTILDQCRKATS